MALEVSEAAVDHDPTDVKSVVNWILICYDSASAVLVQAMDHSFDHPCHCHHTNSEEQEDQERQDPQALELESEVESNLVWIVCSLPRTGSLTTW